MRVFALLFVMVLGVSALPGPKAAASCDPEECKLPECLCSSTNIPGGMDKEDTPQFVLLTYDDGVTISNFKYYTQALDGRKNPNGCPVAATFFVTHAYTNYSMVHELHARGMEIALHSITHKANTTYWETATVELLKQEFDGQRDLMEKFAKIPREDMKGIRMPFLQMASNNQFEMLNDNGFLYDLSWPTQEIDPGMWPYTLEYRSTQDCPIGPCPTESYPNVWVIPMIDWKDLEGNLCAMMDSCNIIPEEAGEIKDWMIHEFNRQYNRNRAPVGLYLHASWFDVEAKWEAYRMFLDYLQTLPDVFIVSPSQVIDWIKDPVKVSDMVEDTKCQRTYTPNCIPKLCRLLREGKDEFWMTSCVPDCPNSYPWLGNPLGDIKYD